MSLIKWTEKNQRRKSFLDLPGVGDDEEGWGADGQHAILWHKGLGEVIHGFMDFSHVNGISR